MLHLSRYLVTGALCVMNMHGAVAIMQKMIYQKNII